MQVISFVDVHIFENRIMTDMMTVIVISTLSQGPSPRSKWRLERPLAKAAKNSSKIRYNFLELEIPKNR